MTPPTRDPAADQDAAGQAADADATRRTYLALERTYLAWWRTGLTSFAVALGFGKVAPELDPDRGAAPWQALGIGFAVLGATFIAYGLRRDAVVRAALHAGRYAEPDRRALAGLTAVGIVLGVGLVALVLLD
jgi:putative membrane protein